jgi:hypothetical protein
MALAASVTLSAGTYYVSLQGTVDGDGSAGKPWPSVEVALSEVGGGHTIVVKAGRYAGGITIPKSASGTPAAPTIIQSEVKWGAVVLGSASHGITSADGADYVVIDGFEVTGALADGIKMQGNYGVVRNCWVHGSTAMGISAHTRAGWTIERNLIEFNGQNPQFHHGIYADGDRFVIRDNIIRHNAGYGIQAYPAASNGYIMNNLVYGHARKHGLILQSGSGGGKNVVSNNTFADNAGGGINISNGNVEAVVNNIITAAGAPISMNSGSKNVWFAYNLCQPGCGGEGEGNLTGDPQFSAPMKGAYVLTANSPAIEAGNYALSPAQDFWGNTRKPGAVVDLGALPFCKYLTLDASRSDWYSGYAYRYSLNRGQEMPDLWTLPPDAVAEFAGR